MLMIAAGGLLLRLSVLLPNREESELARLDFGSREIVEQSAENGGTDALFQLGLLYSAGREVELDLVAAHKWFNLAALRGNLEAKILRQEVAQDMSRAEIAMAQRMARRWLSQGR